MAKKLTDEEVLAKVLPKARDSVGWFDSRLSKERQRALDYYNGKLPRRQSEGRSSFISNDVYDSVEMQKAQLLEVFGAGDDIVAFDPDQDMGADACRSATQYASYVIFSQNPGFQILNDVIHDGLMARVGVVKCYWDERHDYVDEEFRDLPEQAVMGLAMQDNVDDLEADPDEQTGLYSGRIVRKIDRSQVVIVTVPPEEFLIEPRAVSIDAANYVGHRTLKTKADLIASGYDAAKIKRIAYDDARSLDISPERLAREAPVETAMATNDPIQPELEQIMLYESYVRMKIEDSKGVRRYCVVHAGSEILEIYEVEKAPFFPYAPLPVPHSFWGNSFAGRVMPTQNARTVLTRSILDHASITNNPRFLVVQGGLLNPREMLDNRLGGLVNVKRADSVQPLMQSALNPFTFETLKLLQEDREETTGISALSQGLNKDAISKQNSKGLVDNMISASGTRGKISARHFAYGFLVPLYIEVIRLTIENESKAKVVEVAGKPINVDPQSWSERRTCTVSMHLGYGERDMAVSKRQVAYQGMAQDPALGNMFGPPQKYAMIRDTMKLAGIWSTDYLAAPDKVPPVQPDPLKMKELDIKDKLAQASLMTAQAHVDKENRNTAINVDKASLDHQKFDVDTQIKLRDAERHDLEAVARIDIAHREMDLEESMPDSSRKAIVAPNP